MFNLIDMLQQAQGGAGMKTMAHQFGLSQDQARRAMEALLPAFAIGMQRNTSADPTGLSQLFGSPMLTQAVLQQAALTSGVGTQVLRQMLPVIAGSVVASLVHMLLNPPQAEPARAADPFPLGTAWMDAMKMFLPPAEPAAAPRRAPEPPRPAAARPGTGTPQGNAGQEMLQQILRTGAEVQERNVKAMQDLFDTFWSEPGKDGGRERRGAPARAETAAPQGSPERKGSDVR